jgi:hypothetical protein
MTNKIKMNALQQGVTESSTSEHTASYSDRELHIRIETFKKFIKSSGTTVPLQSLANYANLLPKIISTRGQLRHN